MKKIINTIEVLNTLESFGDYELDQAIDILQQYKELSEPVIYEDGVHLDFNSYSGLVYLVNSFFDIASINPDNGKLEKIHFLDYSGEELYTSQFNDLDFENLFNDYDIEDIKYMFDNGSIVEYELNEVDNLEDFNNYYLTDYSVEDLKNNDVIVKSNDECFQIVSHNVEVNQHDDEVIYVIQRS